MTPTEEAARAQRRWIVSRLGATAAFLVLVAVAVVLIGPLRLSAVGMPLLVLALIARIAFPFVADRLANRGLPTTRVTAPVPESARANAAEWNSEE